MLVDLLVCYILKMNVVYLKCLRIKNMKLHIEFHVSNLYNS